MQVEQTKLLDSLAYHNTQDTSKGIENYIASGTGGEKKFSISGAQKNREESGISMAETVDMSGATYLRPGAEDAKTVADTLPDADESAMDRYNEMAVVSNTASGEDLKKMQEDGFSIADTDSRTIITVTDKIKAALAKAGVDVSYGDELSKEQLAEITGSTELAEQIASQLAAYDLPATAQNLEDMAEAEEKLEQLAPLGEKAIAYLIKNELPPTIENVYRAEYSAKEQGAGGYPDGRQAGGAVQEADFAQMQEQIERVIRYAGLTICEESIKNSRFLLQNGLPLTAENLAYLADLKKLSAQLLDGGDKGLSRDMGASMCDAIAEGQRPMNAMLLDGYSVSDHAKESAQVIAKTTDIDLAYVLAQGKEVTVENLKHAQADREADEDADRGTMEAAEQMVSRQDLALLTAKRQLEEVRLAMTSAANYALLKKGISIDTKPLVELVDALKEQEDGWYRALLASEGLDTPENVSVFKETHEAVEDLKTAPAYILKLGDPDTLRNLHDEGEAQKEAFAKANESYEALMTAPRKDMGDSIAKAFRNTDDILKDLGLETNAANRRAVRILAYNSMELTPENIAQIKEKDEEVQRAFSNMTPKVTLEMIRKGINPLDLPMDKLNQAAQEIRDELGDEDTERFQKFLWKLEQDKSISEEERSAYIGIYRLIAQVEKTDGAAIGSLMQQGADITMRSLLTAVRTGKKGSMDYRIDEQFAGVEGHAKNERIDEQISAAYQANCLHDAAEQMTPQAAEALSKKDIGGMTPEQVKETVEQAVAEQTEADAALEQQYVQEQMEDFAEVLKSPEEIYAFLERANIPNSVQNILAVREMLTNRNRMFETLWNTKGATAEAIEQIEDMKNMILERFGEAVKNPSDMADAQEALAEVAERVMETMIIENDTVQTVDIKALRLMNTQFALCAKQAKEEECYMIPIPTGEGTTGISLKIVRGTKEKGLVDILFRGSVMGKVAATFEAKEKGISGMLATDNEETRRLLSDHLGMLAEALGGEDGEAVDLRVAKVDDAAMTRYEETAGSRRGMAAEAPDDGETPSGSYEVQTKRLYHIAESFIKTIQEFL